MPDEILTDHPKRYRAMFVESGNPAHSIADSQRMREALQALELLVVIDVAMTETARPAHYVLPAASQFEKAEATFFNFEFPRKVFHLRHPILEPLPGKLVEPEIHARLAEAMGYLVPEKLAPLHEAALKVGRHTPRRSLRRLRQIPSSRTPHGAIQSPGPRSTSTCPPASRPSRRRAQHRITRRVGARRFRAHPPLTGPGQYSRRTMRRTRFDQDVCPIARTTDLLGDWWTPMVLRTVLFGVCRFEDLQTSLGVSRTTLTQRLNRLVDEGMLERVQYQPNPPRFEYLPTQKGREFFDVLAAMWTWGDRWMFDGGPAGKGPPLRFADRESGDTTVPIVVDARSRDPIDVGRIRVRRKPRPTGTND